MEANLFPNVSAVPSGCFVFCSLYILVRTQEVLNSSQDLARDSHMLLLALIECHDCHYSLYIASSKVLLYLSTKMT